MHETTYIPVSADFIGDVTRAAFPRQLIVYDEKSDKWSPCIDERVLAGIEYLAVSYRQTDFPDKVKLEETIREICHFSQLTAYWLDYACTGVSQAEKNRDLYRIADVFRGASKTLILIAGNDAQPLSTGWRSWGDRVWTLPEALLSQELMYRVGSRPVKKGRLRQIANMAYEDRQEEMILIDGYSGKEPLPLKERMHLLRKAIWKRTSGPDSTAATGSVFTAYLAERVYALMGLMPYRIMPDSMESEAMAYSRLLGANGIDDNTLSRNGSRASSRTPTPNPDTEVEELSRKMKSHNLDIPGPSASSSDSRSRSKTQSPAPSGEKDATISSTVPIHRADLPRTTAERVTLSRFDHAVESFLQSAMQNSNLDLEIMEARRIASDYPYEHPAKPKLLCYLAQLLHKRYQKSYDLEELNEALINVRTSLYVLFYIHRDIPEKDVVIRLALTCWKSRYPRIDPTSEFRDAFNIIKEDLKKVNDNDPYGASYVNDAACCVMSLYWMSSRFDLLDDLVGLLKLSLTTVTDDKPEKAAYYYFIGTTFFVRYNVQNQLTDLEESKTYLKAAVNTSRHDFPEKAEYLSCLAEIYNNKFIHEKDYANLAAAVSCAEQSVQLTPVDSISMPSRRADLCKFRRLSFEITSNMADLELSKVSGQESVRLAGDDNPIKPRFLLECANTLAMYVGYAEPQSYVRSSIELVEKGVQLLDSSGARDAEAKRGAFLAVLMVQYRTLYELTKDSNDLDMSVKTGGAAVAITWDDNMMKSLSCAEYGVCLSFRAELRGDLAEAQQALRYIDLGIVNLPDTHIRKPHFLYVKGLTLIFRYEKLNNSHDIDSAIDYEERALLLLTDDHEGRSDVMKALSEMHLRRYSVYGNSWDNRQAIEYETAAAREKSLVQKS